MRGLLKETIEEFPISIAETMAGTLVPEVFHDHEFIEVVVVYAGEGFHIVDGSRALIHEGDVLLIYPHAVHGYTECGTLGLLSIMYAPDKLPLPVLDGPSLPLFQYFFPTDLDQAACRKTPGPILHIGSLKNLEFLVSEARLLKKELTGHQPGNMLGGIIRLLGVLQSIQRFGQLLDEDFKEKRDFPMGKILSYINKNYTKDIAVGELIKMSPYSRCTFQYKFKNLTGCSTTEYILRKRIAMAQTLLRKDLEMPVGEVAYACGYLDSNYFTRIFRKITGMTPREYRRIGE